MSAPDRYPVTVRIEIEEEETDLSGSLLAIHVNRGDDSGWAEIRPPQTLDTDKVLFISDVDSNTENCFWLINNERQVCSKRLRLVALTDEGREGLEDEPDMETDGWKVNHTHSAPMIEFGGDAVVFHCWEE